MQTVRGGSLIFRTLFSIDVQQIFLEFSHFHSLLSVRSISQLLAFKKMQVEALIKISKTKLAGVPCKTFPVGKLVST